MIFILGAFILQNFVEDLHKMFDEDLCVEDKRIDNVVMFLCHLYNFKVCFQIFTCK